MRSLLIILLLIFCSQANAYVYKIDPSNKYHTAPPIIIEDDHAASRAGQAIGRPVGYIVGGTVGVVAGLLEGLAEGISEGIERTL